MAPQPRARKLEQAIWTYKNSVELRGFEPLTPSMRTRSLPEADVADLN